MAPRQLVVHPVQGYTIKPQEEGGDDEEEQEGEEPG